MSVSNPFGIINTWFMRITSIPNAIQLCSDKPMYAFCNINQLRIDLSCISHDHRLHARARVCVHLCVIPFVLTAREPLPFVFVLNYIMTYYKKCVSNDTSERTKNGRAKKYVRTFVSTFCRNRCVRAVSLVVWVLQRKGKLLEEHLIHSVAQTH